MGEDVDSGATASAQFFGQALEAVPTPRHQGDMKSGFGERAGKFSPDALGGSRDQGDVSSCLGHGAMVAAGLE